MKQSGQHFFLFSSSKGYKTIVVLFSIFLSVIIISKSSFFLLLLSMLFNCDLLGKEKCIELFLHKGCEFSLIRQLFEFVLISASCESILFSSIIVIPPSFSFFYIFFLIFIVIFFYFNFIYFFNHFI